jgi:hypothetical protein
MSSPVRFAAHLGLAPRSTFCSSPSTSPRASSAQTRTNRRVAHFGRVARFAPSRAASRSDDADGEAVDEDASVFLPDLTQPGLTPWEVLGVDASDGASFNPTVGEARAAFRRQIRSYHPDVYRGSGDATAQTKILVAALRAVLDDAPRTRSTSTSTRGATDENIAKNADDADPFKFPESHADSVFVNPFVCRGRSCPSYCCCVRTAPFAFEWVGETGKARFKPNAPSYSELRETGADATAGSARVNDDDTAKMAYLLNCAVQQCPSPGAISWVTPGQRKALEEILENAVFEFQFRGTGANVDQSGTLIADLLRRASFENGRFAAPARRNPKNSGRWVDWY